MATKIILPLRENDDENDEMTKDIDKDIDKKKEKEKRGYFNRFMTSDVIGRRKMFMTACTEPLVEPDFLNIFIENGFDFQNFKIQDKNSYKHGYNAIQLIID